MDLEQVKGLLPDIVVEIAEVIGFPATARLIKVFGGTSFTLGRGLLSLGAARAKLMRETIGEENTARLVQHFRSGCYYLPRCDAALRALRNREFLREFAELRSDGVSSPSAMIALCPRYGFSDRFAWDLIKASRAVSAQQHSLF